MSQVPTLEQIQKATAYHRETLQVAVVPVGLNVPIGAKTALLTFQASSQVAEPMLYAEGDTNLTPNIPISSGSIKELVGYEMQSFRAVSTDADTHFIHVTYTK